MDSSFPRRLAPLDDLDRDPTKFTEFGDIGEDDDEEQSGFGNSLAKWFFGSSGTTPQRSRAGTPLVVEEPPVEVSTSTLNEQRERREIAAVLSEQPSVLDRIKNLFGGSGPSAEADLKAFWMPDAVSKECYDCGEKFTTFRRRHHCRVCGQIFCSKCRSEELPGKLMGIKGNLKVCKYCGRVASNFVNANPVGKGSGKNDVLDDFGPKEVVDTSRSPAEKFESSTSFVSMPEGSARKKSAVGYQEELFTSPRHSSSVSAPSLSDGFADLMLAIAFCTDRFHAEHGDGIFLGADFVRWMLREGKCETEPEAERKAGSMVTRGMFLPVDDRRPALVGQACVFDQDVPYCVNKFLDFSGEKPEGRESDPTWVEQIHGTDQKSNLTPSSTTLYLNSAPETSGEMSAFPSRKSRSSVDSVVEATSSLHPDLSMSHISEEFLRESVLTPMSKHGSPISAAVGWHSASTLNKENGELAAFTQLVEGYKEHETRLIRQLLDQNGLDQDWAGIIIPLVHKIVEVVRPDVKNSDDMDICQYVQIKKVPGGSRSETSLLNGVVCTKNVAHRTMAVRLTDPQILLLGTSLMYQRGESKFISLEPLVLQEYEYLKNVVAKMMSYKPDIIMIGKTAARVAQDLLKDCGVTLIINVKPSVMDRVARLTQAQIVPCMDAQIVKPQLGLCHSFYLKTFEDHELPVSQKTLMYFDGCASHLGLTVVLRGGNRHELKKVTCILVKSVMQFVILVAYNSRLERSFLMDEGAMPPPPNSMEDVQLPPSNEESSSVCFNLNESDAESELEAFRVALRDAVLYSSPFLRNEIPHLLTQAGMETELRKFFPPRLYPLGAVEYSDSETDSVGGERKNVFDCGLPTSEYHPFITAKVTCPEQKVYMLQNLLADFRARGGLVRPSTRILFRERMKTHCSSVASSAFTEVDYCPMSDSRTEEMDRAANALDPHNHQRMAVLFSSYSPTSNNAPNYCTNPWVVNMNFYGTNDIPLGGFLERYCFRKTYSCPSSSCGTGMMGHIRRFVHDKGCVQIIMRELSEPIPVKHQGILVWNWCSKCQQISSVVPLSLDGWGLSFAKYLELRFHGGFYKRRGLKPSCQHSLHHEHYQYFGCDDTVVSFKYYPILLREIVLPPALVVFGNAAASVAQLRATLIDEVSSLSVQGHGSYSSIFEKLHELEAVADPGKFQDMLKAMSEALDGLHSQFRGVLEELQLLLANLKSVESKVEGEQILCQVEGKVVHVKVLQCKIISAWNSRIQEIHAVKKKEEKARPSSSRVPNETSAATVMEQQQQQQPLPSSSTSDVSDVGDPTGKVHRSESTHSLVANPLNTTSTTTTAMNNLGGKTNVLTSKEVGDGKKNPFFATLACLANQPLAFPFPTTQHLLLPPCVGMPVIIYEKEPSSIVAYTLSSGDYKDFIKEADLNSAGSRQRRNSGASSSELFLSTESRKTGVLSLFSDAVSVQSVGSLDHVSSETQQPNHQDKISKKLATNHPEFEFSDPTASSSSLPNGMRHVGLDFRNFRAKRFDGLKGEEKFVRSLARCVPWAAKGGKSGSDFCKTVDDRFILKQMSRFEMQSFLDFGPHYFRHVENTNADGKPTALAKILGVFRLGYKNTQNNSGSKMDVLVMENLFYGRRINQKFDLKGSVRNRLAKDYTKLETDYVLLDENLLKMTCGNPLYIRPHSKRVLTRAITHDTEFLAAQDVMDYSLLVGVDEDTNELVVGIIDYIRTFTWDKKLEMVVKSSGILGGQGKLPTVVSPELYRARFCEAMDKYFLLVPDRWTGLARPVCQL
ncbi:unnamed protein product [Notodromas monacha]|uniref:1-phosphatidylinositol-3-phosphate 5-kinase n=1 Tax=Notodromas monacha TaxID=399045 RepID=A0A7R9BS15_9CRUS|nr:unnamed protein product [Notodromas monacha]CAG0920643.1 unnamed protein product [Notodromas monacha]